MTVPATPRLLADVLDRQVRERPESMAVEFGAERLHHADLALRCERVASLLWHDWGVRAGNRVAWLGTNHPGELVLLFALARLGAILVPIDHRLDAAELETLMADATPRHLVHDTPSADTAQALGARCGAAVHPAAALDAAGDRGDPPPTAREPAAPVLLAYTSGANHRFRGVVHSQASLLAGMEIAAQVQRITAQDSIAAMLPLFHVGGLCIQVLPALGAGATVILHPQFSADAALQCFQQQRPSLTLQVPATMQALVEHPGWPQADLSSLRALWCHAGVPAPALVQAFHARGVPVCSVYGASETGSCSIALPPERAPDHVGSCGWPAPGVEVRLLDPRDGVGEVLVRGPSLASHYWPRHPLRDAGGWFRTGDLATQAADGSYRVVGRV
jgi:fatty-acyl-CoA synthase